MSGIRFTHGKNARKPYNPPWWAPLVLILGIAACAFAAIWWLSGVL